MLPMTSYCTAAKYARLVAGHTIENIDLNKKKLSLLNLPRILTSLKREFPT
jgi:hypothetical protein